MTFLLPAFNPGPLTGAGNNTYLIPGPEPLLVDAGVGDPRHLDALAEALGGVPLARVVVTHDHADHASGAAALLARWPGVTLLKMPWPGRDRRDGRGGVRVDAAGRRRRPRGRPGDGFRLQVVWTPGHAPDHVCLFEPAGRVLFGGDLLVQNDTVVIPASDGGSLTQYLASLARVRALVPSRVLPAHGPAIDDPAALIDRYVEHRRAREAQILRALAAGPLTPADIVARVYVGLKPALVDFARESVLAHLVKLEEEGKVTREGGREVRIVEC